MATELPKADHVTPASMGTIGSTSLESALVVRDLSLSFGSKKVMERINVEIPRGHITALIGPSGSGKSTFLRAINRMNERVSGFSADGEISFQGENVLSPEVDLRELRRQVGMLFQRPNPFPMSISDNVIAGVRAHRIAGRRQWPQIVEARLSEVGLWDALRFRLSDSPFRLSGGQQQLLCLARALAVGPDMLLLDEPTSSLDPISMESVETLLRGLVPALTLIIVTHNLAQARRVSDYTMFFYEGQMVEFGPTPKMFDDPQHPETQHYVSGRIG
jgi:phosphate transport system ATP-binding protein